MGGGTLDVTLLSLRDNVYEFLATAGDTFLGGDDFDARLVDRAVDFFLLQIAANAASFWPIVFAFESRANQSRPRRFTSSG